MKRAVICFTRVPKPGVTKTRLLPVLTPGQCARLHWSFLKDLAAVYRERDDRLFVAYTPDADWEQLKAVFPSAEYIPQTGKDLGERMYRAICSVMELGYTAVVLTGADLPLLTKAHLESAFSVLEEKDIAIGPTSDGGYYLIGMKKPHWEVFHVEGYGGSSVFESTVAAAKNAGLTLGQAIRCDDVDTPEDLKQLCMRADPVSHTAQYLEILKQEGVSL